MACSFILSGLRVFDIRNPRMPVEVGYFNVPVTPMDDTANPVSRAGAFAMSGPAWDVEAGQVWYTDGNQGFRAVQLVGAARAALDGTSPVPTGSPGAVVAGPAATAPSAAAPTTSQPSTGAPVADGAPSGAPTLPSTGPAAAFSLTALLLLAAAGLAGRGRRASPG